MAPPGRCEEGVTRLPFALPLRPPAENPGTPLFETYHGINVSVQYGVAAEMERSMVRGGKLSTVRKLWTSWCVTPWPVRRNAAAVQGLIEFIIEERGGKREQDACETSPPVDFVLTPDEEARTCTARRGRAQHT